jgi:hypothetical protein
MYTPDGQQKPRLFFFSGGGVGRKGALVTRSGRQNATICLYFNGFVRKERKMREIFGGR